MTRSTSRLLYLCDWNANGSVLVASSSLSALCKPDRTGASLANQSRGDSDRAAPLDGAVLVRVASGISGIDAESWDLLRGSVALGCIVLLLPIGGPQVEFVVSLAKSDCLPKTPHSAKRPVDLVMNAPVLEPGGTPQEVHGLKGMSLIY